MTSRLALTHALRDRFINEKKGKRKKKSLFSLAATSSRNVNCARFVCVVSCNTFKKTKKKLRQLKIKINEKYFLFNSEREYQTQLVAKRNRKKFLLQYSLDYQLGIEGIARGRFRSQRV